MDTHLYGWNKSEESNEDNKQLCTQVFCNVPTFLAQPWNNAHK